LLTERELVQRLAVAEEERGHLGVKVANELAPARVSAK
jgi:hypothetical protein